MVYQKHVNAADTQSAISSEGTLTTEAVRAQRRAVAAVFFYNDVGFADERAGKYAAAFLNARLLCPAYRQREATIVPPASSLACVEREIVKLAIEADHRNLRGPATVAPPEETGKAMPPPMRPAGRRAFARG